MSSTTNSLPPLIPREILFGNPEKTSPKLSPDGKYIAYIAPDQKNILQVWLRNVEQTDDQILTADKKRGIRQFFWTYHPNQLIYLQDTDGDENFHLYLVNIQSQIVRDLTPFQGVKAQMVGIDPQFPDQLLVGLNLENLGKFDVYRINLKNGAVEFDTANSGKISDWTANAELQVLAATDNTSDGGKNLLYRPHPNQPWEILHHWSPDEEGGAVSFSADAKILYIRGNHHANAKRLLAIDLHTRKETVIAEDPQYDVIRTFIQPITRVIQAVSFYKDKQEWQIIDQTIAADFAKIAQVHSGEFSVISRDLADQNWIVFYESDNSPGYYYIYHRDSQVSTFLFSNREKLAEFPLASMQAIAYSARDGLTIHGYLTTPVGIQTKNLASVLLVHGGPWGRDTWGYDSTAQWLANRGYAVLQVNFRGSAGYGKAFLNAGNREWAGKMHDDLIDGVNWLIQQGISDPDKIAIMGASYGGYSTLVGLTFTPEVFAAGVDLVGPSNIVTLLQSIPPYWQSRKAMLFHRTGNVDTEVEFLESRSPLFFVDRIQKPLLIAQGANDPRVKQSESDQIVNAMRQAGLPVEYLLYTDEGHGLARPENRLHFYGIAEEFLAKYLGGRFEPMGDIQGHSGQIR